MKLREADFERVVVELGPGDLTVVINALNEVCNGLTIPDFHARMGVDRPTAELLLMQLQRAADMMVPIDDTPSA